MGVRMGQVFALSDEFTTMELDEIERLLASPTHEVRAGGVKIMANQAKDRKTTDARRKELFDLYLRSMDRINNWDLVDLGAWDVVGRYLGDKAARRALRPCPLSEYLGASHGCAEHDGVHSSRRGRRRLRDRRAAAERRSGPDPEGCWLVAARGREARSPASHAVPGRACGVHASNRPSQCNGTFRQGSAGSLSRSEEGERVRAVTLRRTSLNIDRRVL